MAPGPGAHYLVVPPFRNRHTVWVGVIALVAVVVRRMAARAGALVGTVLLLLSILADHGWGPIVKTWSEVAAGTGMVLLGPLWLVDLSSAWHRESAAAVRRLFSLPLTFRVSAS